MKRQVSAEKPGAKVSGVTDEDIMGKFGMSLEDYKAMPGLCQLALKEAVNIAKSKGSAANVYLVIAQSEDGDNFETMVHADSGEHACNLFLEDQDMDSDAFTSLASYAMPTTAPERKGIMNWGQFNCHRVV